MTKTIPNPQADETLAAGPRTLAVVDWSLDPNQVIGALQGVAGAELALLVPARLHGLDWIGDPTASRPCAERQLRALGELGREAGLRIGAAGIGQPERVPAIREAARDWSAERILVIDRPRRRLKLWPFALKARVRRSTRLPIESVAVSTGAGPGARRRRTGAVRCCQPAAAVASTTAGPPAVVGLRPEANRGRQIWEGLSQQSRSPRTVTASVRPCRGRP